MTNIAMTQVSLSLQTSPSVSFPALRGLKTAVSDSALCACETLGLENSNFAIFAGGHLHLLPLHGAPRLRQRHREAPRAGDARARGQQRGQPHLPRASPTYNSHPDYKRVLNDS